eukprot:gene7238-8415_t
MFTHKRNEISTPLTGFKRLTEGLHLQTLGLSPYAGSAFHQPPLLLLLFEPFYNGGVFQCPQILFLLVDIVSACLLRSITLLVPKVLPSEMKEQLSPSSNFPNVVVALFLFNPFSIFTSIGMSTIVINNLIILASLYYSLKGNMFLIAYILRRSHIPDDSEDHSLPVYVVFSLRILIVFVFSMGAILYLSFTLVNSWEFIEKVYGFTLRVEDLTPNIEVFEHFRKFFLFIFQYHVFIYTIPLAIRLRNHPLFFFWTICAIIATFKSYPALGDTALHISLLPLLYEPLKGVRYSFIIVVVAIYVTVLAPILWQMWIYQGTGNANFYYTINLVFTLAQVLLIVDAVSVLLKLDYLNKVNEESKAKLKQT